MVLDEKGMKPGGADEQQVRRRKRQEGRSMELEAEAPVPQEPGQAPIYAAVPVCLAAGVSTSMPFKSAPVEKYS